MSRALIIIPYKDLYPPMNGGMQRCFHILHQLSCHFEVTAIINQDSQSFSKCYEFYPSLAKATIISTAAGDRGFNVFQLLPGKLQPAISFRWYKKSLKGPADSLFLAYYPFLRKVLAEEKFDIVVLENLATLNAAAIVKKYNRSAKIIYDAHNVDTNLAKEALKKNEISSSEYKNIEKQESKLYQTVDALFTCSDHDNETFKKINSGNLIAGTIPNGVEVPATLYNQAIEDNDPEFIMFCGALWTLPNAEGLYWFCKNVLPGIKLKYPTLKLLVIGGGKLPDKYLLEEDENISFAGAVPDLKEWYNRSAVAIAPLLTGSGTRLKILEAMGYGVPVVSTAKGAEGIEYTNKENIFIADSDCDFANAVCELIADKTLRNKLSKNARALAAGKYDWEVIGNKMADFINKEVL